MMLEITRFLEAPGRRLPIDVTLPGGRLDPDDPCEVKSVRVKGEAFAQHGTLFVHATLQASLVQPCARCLEPTKTSLDLVEEIEIPIAPTAVAVDLTPDVLRLVLSSRKPNVLCKPECLGLCPVCGVNLNEDPKHTCNHEKDNRITLRDWMT